MNQPHIKEVVNSQLAINMKTELEYYVDEYGRYHDVPVNAARQPSSDNGWLYSAIGKKIGAHDFLAEYNRNHPSPAALYCVVKRVRHPKGVTNRDQDIPISRDEILGLVYLGYMKPDDLTGWNFSPFKMEKFNLIRLIKQLWEAKGEHRNYFWRNDLKQIYRFAFSVPLQDRHFINSCWGRYNFFYHMIHVIDNLIPKKNRSSRNMRFLKTGKDIKGVVNYFGSDHAFTKLINLMQVQGEY